MAALLHFSTVSFSLAEAILAGRAGPIDDADGLGSGLVLESRGGQVKAQASALTANGMGFGVVWHHR